mgnify:CR=1 FL=1|jgi:hypothetical protein
MSFTQEDMDKLFPRKSVEFLQAENSTLKEELKAINAALDDPRTDLTMAACEVIVALKEQVAQLQDSSIDKLMGLTDEQVTALTRLEGSNPDDAERIAKQAMKLAMLNVELTTLQSKSAALVDTLSLVVFGEGDWFNLMPASLHDQLCEALAAFKGESDDTRST